MSFVLTGMIPYKELNQGDALAYALIKVGQNVVSGFYLLEQYLEY